MALYKPQYKDSNGNIQDLNIKAGDTTLFDSKQPSYYLNYNNLTNKPTIPSITNCVKYDDTLQNTNPFGGKKLYINSIDNAFASADKRYWVTVTKHKRSDNGVTYPYADTSKAITDDNYYVDGPVVADLTSSAHNLFDGSYESTIGLENTGATYLKIRVMFGSNTSPSASTSYWSGYPYGYWYLSFYYNNTPNVASQARVYNKYAAHTVGWHLYNSTWYSGSASGTNVIQLITDTNDYQRTCVDFIVFGNDTSTRTVGISQIEYKLQRPNLSANGSTVTKYGAQELNWDFTWKDSHAETLKISAAGTLDATKVKLKGNAISPASGQAVAVYDSNGFQRTTSTFDGSTTTKYLSQKGTFENLPSLDDFVTLSTDQDITGHKTFTVRPSLEVTRLPSTYQEVTYIESDGTAYINTDKLVHMGWKYRLTFQQNTTSTYRSWGVFNQSSYNGGLNCSLTYATNSWMIRWETVNGQTRAVDLPRIDTQKHTLYIDDGEVYFDGVDYGKTAAHDSSVVSIYPAYLFTINPGGTTPTTNLNGKVYSYQVWDENGDAVQDLVPCYRKADGVIGMYDMIEGEFYINAASSGTFSKGTNVVDSDFLVISDLSDIPAATKTKITYDTRGLVIDGTDLAATDIPALDTSKITTGTFPDARIASASTWNGKVNGSNLTTDKIVVGNGTNNIKVSDKSIQDIVDIAEGKTKTYIISVDNQANPKFADDSDSITLESSDTITDINGNTIDKTKLNTGDIFLITSTDYPDRWFAEVSSGNYIFYTLETQSVDLSNYVTLGTDQTITGEKTFTQRPKFKSDRLPNTYQEVDSITLAATSSTGNYINTGVVITQADALSIELDGAWNGDNNSFATFFGFMAAGTTPRCAVSVYQNKYMIGIDSTTSGASTPTQGRARYKFYTSNGNQYLTINNNTEVSTSYSSSALNNNTLPLYIGARNTGGTANNFSGITIYSFYISTATASYSYIPCYRKSDNQIGLYEIINDTFYPVIGTGTPTKGTNVEDSEFLVFNDLAPVAISNNYNDLNNKPTIPTVSNATITIKQTGISDQTFTLNGSTAIITLVDTNDNTTYTLSHNETEDAQHNPVILYDTVKLTPSPSGSVQTITINDVAHAIAADAATNADTLDGEHGSYYLDWDNFTVPSTIVYTNTNQEITGEKTFTLPIVTTDSSNIGLIVREDSTHQTQYKKNGITVRTINSGSTPPTDVTLTYPSTGGTIAITDDIHDGSLVLKVNGTQKATFSANSNNSQDIEFDVTAADLGLSQAMSFVGISTTDPTSTTGATVSEHTSWSKGEIVIYKRTGETYYEEYINITGSNTSSSTPNPNWELLGDADSYAMKSVTITGTGALSGGGDLSANREITHNAPSDSSAISASSGFYKFSTDAYGHIATTTTVSSTDIFGFLANTGNVTFTNNNSKISANVTIPVTDVQTSIDGTTYNSVLNNTVAKIDLSNYVHQVKRYI